MKLLNMEDFSGILQIKINKKQNNQDINNLMQKKLYPKFYLLSIRIYELKMKIFSIINDINIALKL